MKKLIFVLALFTGLQSFSQVDDNYDGPAKSMVKGFWQQFEIASESIDRSAYKSAESKLSYFDRTVENIRKKDPAYNISAMENKLQGLKDRLNKEKTASLENRKEADELYYQDVKASSALGAFTISVGATKADVEEILAYDKSRLNMDRYHKTILTILEQHEAAKVLTHDIIVANYKERIMKNNVLQGAMLQYESFLESLYYWQTAVKLFPNEPAFKNVSSKYEALAKILGGPDDIAARCAKGSATALAGKKMPSAVLTDSKLEKQFIEAFNDESKGTDWNRTIVKINITSKDWLIIRKEFTGVIVGRKRFAAIVFKDNKTGKCLLYDNYHIYQQYNGSGYNSFATGTSAMAWQDILCESAK